jgi:AraC-like DNA-binding protein
LLEVRLPRTRPSDTRAFQAFFSAPIRFGAAAGELVFREDSLLAPVVSADPVLARILREHADSQLSRLIPDAAMRERARAAVAQQGARGIWDVPAVARQLGMSPRTLRRRLQDEGTSLRAMVDDVRRERALLFAEAGRYNAGEIAVKLGFADTTSLARAFRRWTGASPSVFLRQARSTAL